MSRAFESGFFVEKAAWHGLGTVVKDKVFSTKEAIELAGLNWRVIKRQHNVDLPITERDEEEQTDSFPVPDCYGIYRETDNMYLGKVGARYEPLQNEDAFEWFEPFLHEGDVYLETAGSLNQGRVIWVMARLNDSTDEVVTGDPVEQRLLLTNTHDGSGALMGGFVNERVVCANTLAIAKDEAVQSGNFVRLKHTKNIKLELANVQKIVNLAKRNFRDSVDLYKTLANTEMTTAQFRKSLETLFAKELNKKDEDGNVKTLDTFKPTAQILRNLEATPDLQQTGIRGTGWAAYNAITQFTTHQSKARTADARVYSLWYGAAKKTNEEALELLLYV